MIAIRLVDVTCST